MATTKIWAVNDNLKRVLEYIANPDKTKNDEFEQYEFKGLENVIDYATDDTKTEQQFYVSGINCHPINAFWQMVQTKKAARKEDGVLAFHGYQSFVPGEVTAETAHAIGVELAQKMWGDDFEVVVSTHLDKKHFHNHFVVNSVSFLTRKRFLNKHKDYARFRSLSDELCAKYHLSMIDNPKKGKHYAEWLAEKQRIPTRRTLMIDDVDRAIKNAMTFSQFIRYLKSIGYEVKTNVKHIAIKPPGADNFFRLHKLTKDEAYSEENIKKRILEQHPVIMSSPKPMTVKYMGNQNNVKKMTGLRALYICYMFQMGILPKNAPNKKRVHFLLREELRYMDKITQETTLLCKKKIETMDELTKEESIVQDRLDSLVKERRCLYNKIKRCKKSDTKENLQKDVATLSEEIKLLRKEVRLYEDIKVRSMSMKNKLTEISKERKEREQDERRRRNGRPSRKDELTGN